MSGSVHPRLAAAVLAGRAAAGLSRRLGRGGGTVIAGHVIPRIAPTALRDVTRALPQGSVVLSGTNGKTTTARLIAHILRAAGHRTLHNRAGANLLSGLFTAIVQGSDWRGSPQADVGIFEVDEATLPSALRHVEPRILLLHNIFRDQLDRYGEVHFVAGLWRTAVARLAAQTCLALNADDPLVASLGGDRTQARVVTYGIVAPVGEAVTSHVADARLCPECGAALEYGMVYYGHIGWYACSRCSFKRPTPDVRATNIEVLGDTGSRVALETPAGPFQIHLHLPGLYNVYNALAAVTTCLSFNVPTATIVAGFETFTAAFGRLERIHVEDRDLFLALVKNPVGFTEVLRTILQPEGQRTLLLAINDLFADGTDVSWLWDVEFERLQERVNVAVCTGIRAEDMAVRLKYAGVPVDRLRIEPDPRRALERVLTQSEPGETIYVLPTYTAMLAIRDVLQRTGYVKGFWED